MTQKIDEIGGLTEKWLYHLVPSLEGGASPTKVDEVPRNKKYNTEIGQTDRTSHRKKWPVTFRN